MTPKQSLQQKVEAGVAFLNNKKILDACCGSRMFWFNKKHPDTLYIDNRTMERQLIWKRGKEKRYLEIKPDIVMDFRELDLIDSTFSLVVFDPPHLVKRNGKTGWMNKKYGSLDRDTWKEDLRKGFAECFRVLKLNGILVFKWSESDILVKEVLALTPVRPLFGHRSGKAGKTLWMCFMKLGQNQAVKAGEECGNALE